LGNGFPVEVKKNMFVFLGHSVPIFCALDFTKNSVVAVGVIDRWLNIEECLSRIYYHLPTYLVFVCVAASRNTIG
jgi:hypothetical protein